MRGSFLAVLFSTCPSEPPPALDLAYRGPADDGLWLLERLTGRTFDATDALADVRLSWISEERLTPDAQLDSVLWALGRAGFDVREPEIGPSDRAIRQLSLVTVDLPIDDLQLLEAVDFADRWVRVEGDRLTVGCTCGFPIVPIAITDAAVRQDPPGAPLMVDVVPSEPPLVVLRDAGSARARVFAVGDRLDDGREIVAIPSGAALLDDGSAIAAVVPPRGEDPLGCPERAVRTTPDGYVVRTDDLAPFLDPAILGRLGTATLHHDPDGKVDGVRLTDLVLRRAPMELGLRNGDVVHQVGDVRVDGTNLDAILAEIRTKPELCVRISRFDDPIRLCYRR